MLVVLVVLLAAGVFAARRALAARDGYQAVRVDVHALQADRQVKLDPATLSPDDLARIQAHIATLNGDLRTLDRATALPDPARSLVSRLPWIGERYDAGRQTLAFGLQLGEAGQTLSGVAHEALTAYQQTGLSADQAPATPTWLDVLNAHQAQLTEALAQIDQARGLRAGIDTTLLPASIRTQFETVDQLLARRELEPLVQTDLPAVNAALGGQGPTRYLILIQNSEEMRPSGGFPGTVAIVTFDHGQLRGYEFHDIYDLNGAYVASQHTPIPQPWPLSQYAPSGELSMLDATWWPDFPTSAATVMRMYASSGWPSISGVIAIDPALVSDLLRLTGPVTVDVDGESRVVSADNLLQEIERQRKLFISGQKPDSKHKEMVAAVGEQIIARLRGADPSTLRQAVHILSTAATRRDIQAYSADPSVESLLDQRAWTGKLVPDSADATIAVAYGNMAFGKSSRLLQTTESLAVEPASNGTQRVTLRLDLHHSGPPGNSDPFYSGVQLWWIGLYLPEGSKILSASQAAAPDPSPPNGGSYLVELQPAASRQLTVTFEMPAATHLLLRRQAGLTPVNLSVSTPKCTAPAHRLLDRDQQFDLAAGCAS
ncbi:MAG TPA: DUF4012 domain-containing protein [Thermomicrobiaceae bacterium]|nr:DUF4012 domain-containing protein [Thermomicrobiaceae bacterium]